MDERRFRELEQKRDTVGLTADEANELGRMMAEREGEEYGNPGTVITPTPFPRSAASTSPPACRNWMRCASNAT